MKEFQNEEVVELTQFVSNSKQLYCKSPYDRFVVENGGVFSCLSCHHCSIVDHNHSNSD